VAETLGQVDAVFVNAGFARLTSLEETDERVYDLTFDVNTKGPFFLVQRLAPLVRDGGAFVFTTSVADVTGTPGMGVYSGSKAALRSFARVFAAELAPRGIRVNAVSPGYIKTPTMGVSGASAEDLVDFERLGVQETPLRRLGAPEEAARAALFLAFEATYTTGAELPVDGGLAQL
jgi:NAD(P)-dependent dehydrogenase (short-subunit alcohol dehydrogenase family)